MTASAHNAAHIYVDGRYLAARLLKDALGELDLIYDPRAGVDVSDQCGARMAAIKGNTPRRPGNCPV